ncbi:hypothetical protein KGQ71_03345 [Patescibacteria group bacterium]|nr:hypothetical protein [Patescibacteria group bacterium]
MARIIGLLDLFFPRRCLACGREGAWACADCARHLLEQEPQIDDGIGLLSLFRFEPGLIRELLHALKYNGIREAAAVLSEMAWRGRGAERIQEWTDGAVLIPVPTGSAKRKKRGYNQAEELANGLAVRLGLLVWPGALRRTTERKTQVGKGKADRAEQAAASFIWSGEKERHLMSDRRWIVVDDVCTTGSTITSCMKALQPFSHLPVTGLTIARE